MHRLFMFPSCLLCTLFFIPAYASPLISQHVPDAKEVGSGRLSVVFWDVYDITLYAPEGDWQHSKPFALKITYMRTIDGTDIADRSAEEMRNLGYNNEVKLAAWHSQMRTIFPDVAPGTELTGVYRSDQSTIFYHNNQQIGLVRDPEFGQWFFDIWLSEKTPEPQLRAALLGKR